MIDYILNEIDYFKSYLGTDTLYWQVGGIVLLAILFGLFIAHVARMAQPKVSAADKEIVSGIRGRIEKLERALNDFKTEQSRSIHFIKTEVTAIRQYVRNLEKSSRTNFKSVGLELADPIEPIIPIEMTDPDPAEEALKDAYSPDRDTMDPIKIDWEKAEAVKQELDKKKI